MTENVDEREQMNGLHIHAGKVASMSPDDFRKIAPSDIQKLLQAMIHHAEQSEREKDVLQQSQAQLEEFQRVCTDLYDFAPVGYFNLDESGVIVNVNITARDMLNKSKDELVNSRFISLIHPTYQEGFASYLRNISETGSRLSTELELRRSGGTTFYAQLQTIILNEKSNITYRVSIADITDRKQAEYKLKESEEKYRMLFESMEEGYAFCEMIYDASGKPIDFRYLAVNPAFANLTGFSVERVVGRTVKELIPSIEVYWIETYGRVVQTGQSERFENYVAELGKYYDVHAWRSGPKQFLVVFNDITERKQTQLKTEKRLHELCKKVRSTKSQLIY